MSLAPFPRTPEYKNLKSALDGYAKRKLSKAGKKALKEPPRLIYKGTTSRRTASEFVVPVGDSRRRGIIESCLQQIPRDVPVPVIVFGRDGQKQDFELRKHTSDGGYVFTGNLIGIITNVNENIGQHEIELWGYPDQKLSVFVLTVGVIGE